jgi:Leucine-rich repeat (LRR) protein
LEELNLSGNSGITDAGLKLLCKLTSLEVLELSNNSQITDAGIEYLNSLRKLQYLDLTNTKTTAAGVKRLQQLLPKCNIQHREATIPLESEKRDTKSKDEGITDVDAPKLLDTPGCGDYDYSIGTDAGVKHLAKIKELII